MSLMNRLEAAGWRPQAASWILLIVLVVTLDGPDLRAAEPPDAAPTVSAAPGAPVEAGPIGLRHYLAVSAIVFGLGISIVVVRRNAIAVLMGIELLLNAAALNFVAFSKFLARDMIDGQVIAIFLIVIAAAEAAVALAIILNIFNVSNTVTVDEADELKG
jgi:NADH-quinone oxidoreductase subunit K